MHPFSIVLHVLLLALSGVAGQTHGPYPRAQCEEQREGGPENKSNGYTGFVAKQAPTFGMRFGGYVAQEQLRKEEQRQRKRESSLRKRILSRTGLAPLVFLQLGDILDRKSYMTIEGGPEVLPRKESSASRKAGEWNAKGLQIQRIRRTTNYIFWFLAVGGKVPLTRTKVIIVRVENNSSNMSFSRGPAKRKLGAAKGRRKPARGMFSGALILNPQLIPTAAHQDAQWDASEN